MSKQLLVGISEGLIQELSGCLTTKADSRGITKACEDSIRYWLDNMDWKYNDIKSVQGKPKRPKKSYSWQPISLPHGTSVMMKYKGENYYAEIVDGEFVYDGRSMTPAQFANIVAGCQTNAWIKLYFCFPNTDTWILADDCRKESRR